MGKEYTGELVLASKGLLYGDKFPSGILHVEPWGTKEERLLLSPSIDSETILDRLISRLTDCPIPPGDLLLIDRQHVFFYMRCLSYGGQYSFNFQCSECSAKATHSMNLETDLQVKYADDLMLLRSLNMVDSSEFQEPFEFTLPIQQKRIGWRMLRGKDEKSIDQYVRRQKGSEERPDYIYRLALRIMEIDGTKVEIGDATALVESLKGRDALEIRQQIEAVDIGIDPEVQAKCSVCGYENDVMLPMDKSFFRPSRTAP